MFPQTFKDLATQGASLNAATQLAADEVGAAGGIPGVGFEFRSEDRVDEGIPGDPAACDVAANLIGRGVDAIIGPATSATANRVLGRTTAANGVLISPSSTDPGLSDLPDESRFFRTAATDRLQGRVLGALLASEGAKTVSIVYRDDQYGQSLMNEARKEMSGLGVVVRAATPYPTAGLSSQGETALPDPRFNPALQSMGVDPANKPDAVLLIGFGELAQVLVRMNSELGISTANTKVFGADGLIRETLGGQVGNSGAVLQNLHGTRPLLPTEFKRRVQARDPNLKDFTYTAQAYDAVIITALASAAARSGDPNDVAQQLNDITRGGSKCYEYARCLRELGPDGSGDIDYDGPSGPIDMTGDGEPCQGLYSAVSYDAAAQPQEYRQWFSWYLCTGEVRPSG